MSATILLKSKADASREAVNLLTEWQTQHECKVKFIRTDNGTEFSGLEKFCRKNGAVHQKTAPYAHQQNGKIERLNRTLQEKARAMLTASSLPPEYWGDSVMTCSAEEVLRASKQTKLRSRMNSPYIYQRHSLITHREYYRVPLP